MSAAAASKWDEHRGCGCGRWDDVALCSCCTNSLLGFIVEGAFAMSKNKCQSWSVYLSKNIMAFFSFLFFSSCLGRICESERLEPFVPA